MENEKDLGGALGRAREAMESGEYDIALDYFKEADAEGKKDKETQLAVHAGQAYCLWRMGYYDDARYHYEKALKLDPKDQRLLIEKGQLFLEEERWDDALKVFKQAIKLDEARSWDAWAGKAKAEHELGAGTEAKKSFLHWIEFLKRQNAEVQMELYTLWKGLFSIVPNADLEGLDAAVIDKVRKKKELPPEVREALANKNLE